MTNEGEIDVYSAAGQEKNHNQSQMMISLHSSNIIFVLWHTFHAQRSTRNIPDSESCTVHFPVLIWQPERRSNPAVPNSTRWVLNCHCNIFSVLTCRALCEHGRPQPSGMFIVHTQRLWILEWSTDPLMHSMCTTIPRWIHDMTQQTKQRPVIDATTHMHKSHMHWAHTQWNTWHFM